MLEMKFKVLLDMDTHGETFEKVFLNLKLISRRILLRKCRGLFQSDDMSDRTEERNVHLDLKVGKTSQPTQITQIECIAQPQDPIYTIYIYIFIFIYLYR